MSKGIFIIESALEQIGAKSPATDTPPLWIERGLQRLNGLAQEWFSQEIKVPFNPLEVPGDEFGEPSDTTDAFIFNLAIRLAPIANNGTQQPVSQDLTRNANISYRRMAGINRALKAGRRRVSSTMPRGEGNNDGFENKIYFDEDEPLSG